MTDEAPDTSSNREAEFNLQLTRMMMHQIASPLAGIRAHTSNILSGRIPQDVLLNRIRTIDQMALQALRQIENFKILFDTRLPSSRQELIDIRRFLNEQRNTLGNLANLNNIDVYIEVSDMDSLKVVTDPFLLALAFDNIMDYVFRHSYPTKQANDKVVIVAVQSNEKIIIKITAQMQHIQPVENDIILKGFNKEAKTQEAYAGETGLFIANKCLEAFGGKLEFASNYPATIFSLTLNAAKG